MKVAELTQKFDLSMLNNGRIFNITFIKKDGSIRKMNARLGVKSYRSGGQLKYDPSSRNNLIVFSMDDSGYRTVKTENILRIKCNGNEFLS